MTLVLTDSDVTRLLGLAPYRDAVRAAVERAHADLGQGRAVVPGPPAMTLDGTSVVPMVAVDAASGRAVAKILSDIPDNARRGLPVQRSTILITSAVTGSAGR